MAHGGVRGALLSIDRPSGVVSLVGPLMSPVPHFPVQALPQLVEPAGNLSSNISGSQEASSAPAAGGQQAGAMGRGQAPDLLFFETSHLMDLHQVGKGWGGGRGRELEQASGRGRDKTIGRGRHPSRLNRSADGLAASPYRLTLDVHLDPSPLDLPPHALPLRSGWSSA